MTMKDVRYYDESGAREVLDRKEIPSTCFEDGECTYTRSNGEVKKIEYDDAGGHEYVKQANGDYKCSVCGHVRIEMSEVTVTLSSNLFTYTGGIRQPGTTAVTKDGYVLKKVPAAYPDYASTYKNNINVGTGSVTLTAQRYFIYINMKEWRGNAKGSITVEYEIRPDLPTSINLVEDGNNVVLSWNAAKAEYMLTDNDVNTDLVYVIYKVNADGTTTEIATTKENTYTLTGAEYKGAQFKIGTRGTVNGKTYESINLTEGISTRIHVTVGLNSSTVKPQLKWNDVPGATSYEIYRSVKVNGNYIKVYTTENNSYTHSSAEEGKTYYYKVVALCASGNVISNVVTYTMPHVHSYTSKVINPSCEGEGYTSHTCKCGDSFKDTFVKELGHKFVNYVSDNNATTEKDGTKTAKCERCDVKDTITDVGSKLPKPQDPSKPSITSATRIFGNNRYETAFKVADTLKVSLGVDKFSTVIVANGTNFADALAGSYLATKMDAPILMTDKNSKNVNNLQDYIKANVNRDGTIYILGGTEALPLIIDEGLNDYHIERLAGKDRYETNLLILKAAGVTNEEIIVATGTGFADSLSASATGRPLLLVGKSLNTKQKDFLASLNGNKMYIAGGTAAVSSKVEKELKSYGSVKRLAGNSRYDTSVLIAETFFNSPKLAVVALGTNFPDGLSSGPLAYTLKSPLLLSASQKDSYTTISAYTNSNNITSGYVLGGPGLLNNTVVKEIFK